MTRDTPPPPPSNPPAGLALPAMQWFHLELTHRLLDDLSLPTPGGLGALYRSVFGLALHRRAPTLCERYAGDQSDSLRPWWLWPPDQGDETDLPAGTVLRARFSLHASAVPDVGACLQAFDDFGLLGLGTERSRAVLDAVAWLTPSGPEPVGAPVPPPWCAQDVWQAAQAELTERPNPQQSGVWLNSVTPLRLKFRSALITQPPPLSEVLQACFTRLGAMLRLAQPTSASHPATWLSPEDKTAWLQWSRHWMPDLARTQRAQVHRWSSRQQRAIRIDGLTGAWAYPPEACAALPWLRLGEHLQLGGKTTMGMGAFNVSLRQPHGDDNEEGGQA